MTAALLGVFPVDAGTGRPVYTKGGRFADLDWDEYRRLCYAVQCPRPRCRGEAAGVYGPRGTQCTTPNGRGSGFHREREVAAGVRPAPTSRKRPHRLTDAQAQRIEWAAEAGAYYAAGQQATFGGDALERQIADVLLREGLVESHPDRLETSYGERMLVLTAAGWDVYWHDKLVIRRLPEETIAEHARGCARCGGAS